MPQPSSSYFVIPFLRPSEGAEGAIGIEIDGEGEAQVTCEVFRPNGQPLPPVSARVRGRARLLPELFSVEAGAVHVYVEGAAGRATLDTAGAPTPFPEVDAIAATSFSLPSTDAAYPYAMLANATDDEIFVFVNDNQGPFIPPRGAARIQIPEPGGPLRISVDQGDAVLAYRGAPVKGAAR